jgi:purine-nucleoside phosphorylase
VENRIPDYFRLADYAISGDDVARLGLQCDAAQIQPDVLMTPAWKPEVLLRYVDRCEVVCPHRVYTIEYQGRQLTLIRSGIGAPVTGDVTLALGCTPCRRILFVGSVGGLLPDMTIGDLVLVTGSVGGDGFSMYLPNGPLGTEAMFKEARPDADFARKLKEQALRFCRESNPALAAGRVYSTDTIVAQFHHLSEITATHECIGIEMETSAVFNAAALTGIRAAALLQLSDVIPTRKSLFSGRTEQDHARRSTIREHVLARIALETLST